MTVVLSGIKHVKKGKDYFHFRGKIPPVPSPKTYPDTPASGA
jgi:hypothetical protein